MFFDREYVYKATCEIHVCIGDIMCNILDMGLEKHVQEIIKKSKNTNLNSLQRKQLEKFLKK